MPIPPHDSCRFGQTRSAMLMTAVIGGLGVLGITTTLPGCETASNSADTAFSAADPADLPASDLRNRTISPENDKSRARADAWAQALTGLGFERDADGAITEFFVADPFDAVAGEDLAAHVRQAEDDVRKGRLAAATLEWGNALRMKPTDASIAHGLAKTLARAGKVDEAEAVYVYAADHAEGDGLMGTIAFDHAVLASQQRDFDAAIRLMRDAVSFDPTNGQGWERIAIWSFFQGDVTKARAAADRAESLNHTMPPQFMRQLVAAESK